MSPRTSLRRFFEICAVGISAAVSGCAALDGLTGGNAAAPTDEGVDVHVRNDDETRHEVRLSVYDKQAERVVKEVTYKIAGRKDSLKQNVITSEKSYRVGVRLESEATNEMNLDLGNGGLSTKTVQVTITSDGTVELNLTHGD